MFKFRISSSVLAFLLLLVSLSGIGQNVENNCHLVNYKQYDKSIILNTNQGIIKLSTWSANSFNISFFTDSLITQHSDAVIANQLSFPMLLVDMNDKLSIRMGASTISINKNPLTIDFPSGKDNSEMVKISGPFKTENGSGISILLDGDEKITGGGARAIQMNRRGYRLRLQNEPHWGYSWGEENLNYSVPLFTSNRKYMVLFDSPQRAEADIGSTQPDIFRLQSNESYFSLFIFSGNDYKQLLNEYTSITGTQPLPPRWAFGNLQSRFGYKSQQQTINVADSMIMAGYPLDAMIIDLYWFGKGLGDFRMGNLTWENDNWPDPAGMINYLKSKGVKTILITEPFILTNSNNYSQGAEKGLFGKNSKGKPFIIDDFWFGPASLIDMFNPNAVKWFWDKHIPLINQGIAGWWGDLGEPEKHPSGIIYQQGTSDKIHNIYGHYWSKMLFEFYKSYYPDERLFFLNRAGYAGSQRYSVFPWSGDVSRSWEGFKAQLPIMLGMSLCGIPYMHSDLGGFAGGKMDEELFTRWMQFGVFTPVFRPHGETYPSEPIYYSSHYQKIILETIKLRYRFIPYNYTLAWQQTTNGVPLARPMLYEHPNENNAFDIFETYYWGNNIIVAPVFEPSITSKNVWIPEGTWINFFTNQPFEGNKIINVPVTLNEIPLFVKTGSFIPLASSCKSTDFYSTDTLYVNYYHHNTIFNGKGVMFNDDGKDPKSVTDEKYELLHFSSTWNGKKLIIDFAHEKNNFGFSPAVRNIVLEIKNLSTQPAKVKLDRKNIPFNFNSKTSTLTVPFNWNMTPARIIINL